MPRSLPETIPQKTRGKTKGNRSIRCIPGGNEAIWDEELHAALIEALNIYPPMGRQRIRSIHDGGEGQGRASLGRCQLIQQYLLQRTGKNRTRKQISSRIQRLRRMYQDDPEMANVLRVLPDVQQPVAPEILVDLDDNSQAASIVSLPVPATPPLLGSVESSASSSPSTNLLEDSCHSSASSSSIQSNQLSVRLFETADLHVSNSGDAAIGGSAPGGEQGDMWPDPDPELGCPDQHIQSLSRRRIASNIPGLCFQLDLPPGTQFLLADSGYDFEASTVPVETGSLSLAGNQFPYLSCHGHSAEPITPIDQIMHTPDLPPQELRCDKRSAYQLRRVEKDDFDSQSMTCVPSLNLYDPYPSSHLFAAAEFSSNKLSPFHASRAQNYSFPSSPLAPFHAGVRSASSCLVPLGPEGHQDATRTQDITHSAQLPRRLYYPDDARSLDSGLSLRMASTAYASASKENNVAGTFGNLELAPPAVIRPFYASDFPCPGAGSSPHTTFDELAMASVRDDRVRH